MNARIRVESVLVPLSLLYPVLPLLEYYMGGVIGYLEIQTAAGARIANVPFLQLMVLSLGVIIMSKQLRLDLMMWFFWLVLIVSLANYPGLQSFSVLITVSLAFFLFAAFQSSDNPIQLLRNVVYSFVILSLAIFTVRLVQKGFNYNAARGGANIYGGNPVILAIFVLAVIERSLGNKKNALWCLVFAVVVAVVFVNRLAMVISVFAVIAYGDPRRLLFIIPLMIVGVLYFIPPALMELIANRFSSVSTIDLGNLQSLLAIEGPLGERPKIWLDAFLIGRENWVLGVGLGNYSTQNNFGVSSAHNFLLNTVAELGFVGGGVVLLFLLWRTLVLVKLSQSGVFVILASVFALSNLAGLKLTQMPGMTSSLSLFCLLWICSGVPSTTKNKRVSI